MVKNEIPFQGSRASRPHLELLLILDGKNKDV